MTGTVEKKPRGLFFALEGIDGSGKSTLTYHVTKVLRERGREVVQTHEVGGTPVGKTIRNLCFRTNPELEEIDPLSMILLNYVARIQHIRHLIAPNIQNGIDVVTDRYNFSTQVYQGVLADQRRTMAILEATTPLRMVSTLPDWTFYLKVDPHVAYGRMLSRGGVDNDRYKGSFQQIEANHDAYEQVMSAHKRNHDPKISNSIIYIDANQPIEDIEVELTKYIDAILEMSQT